MLLKFSFKTRSNPASPQDNSINLLKNSKKIIPIPNVQEAINNLSNNNKNEYKINRKENYLIKINNEKNNNDKIIKN